MATTTIHRVYQQQITFSGTQFAKEKLTDCEYGCIALKEDSRDENMYTSAIKGFKSRFGQNWNKKINI